MAVGDTPTTAVTVSTVERAPADAPVRHFDQLSDREQRRFLRRIEGAPVAADDELFTADEVVVFTDYYRVRPV